MNLPTIPHFMYRLHLLLLWILFIHVPASGQVFDRGPEDDLTTQLLNAASSDLGDVDGDGDLDIFVATLSSGKANRLFLNDGTGRFFSTTDAAFQAGSLNSPAGRFVDVDSDGDQDLFVSMLDANLTLFENQGGGEWLIRDDLIPEVRQMRQLSVIDFDADGDLDLFGSVRSGGKDALLANDGSGSFERAELGPVTQDGGDSTCVEWMDADNDGDLDLFVCDANGHNRMYENRGDFDMERRDIEGLTDQWSRTGGASWGDFDGNGFMDLYVANVDEMENELHFNDGNWSFTRTGEGPHVTDRLSSNSSNAADFDNDGDLDLFVTNLDGADRLYLNTGDGTFEWDGQSLGSEPDDRSASAIVGDIDGDGDLDVHVSTLYSGRGGNNATWMNQSTTRSSNNWIHVAVGRSPHGAAGVGARLDLYGSGMSGPFEQFRVMTSSRGSAVGGYIVAFGLGEAAAVDSVRIRWSDGATRLLLSPSVDAVHRVGSTVLRVEADPLIPVFPGNASIGIDIDQHLVPTSSQVFYRNVGDEAWRTGVVDFTGPGRITVHIPGVIADTEYRIVLVSGNVTYIIGTETDPMVLMVRRVEPRIHETTVVTVAGASRHRIGWIASTLDIDVGAMPHYSIWRSVNIPVTGKTIVVNPAAAMRDPDGTLLRIGSDLWEWLGDSPALKEDEYATTQPVLEDASGRPFEHMYRIVAHTSNPDVFHVSESVSISPPAAPPVTVATSENAEGDLLPMRLTAPWPNPSTGRISSTMLMREPGPLTVSVVDMLGRTVTTRKMGWAGPGSLDIQFETDEWSPGVYVLLARKGTSSATRLFTVAR